MRDKNFDCDFCGKSFVSEERFLKHRCKQMIREEEFRTPIGQAAWLYYQKWMKAHHRQVPKSTSFLHSKFYSSFIRFANFVKRVSMPDVDAFINLMVNRDIHPSIWNTDDAYALYLEYLDRRGDPTKHAEITINTLFDIAEAAECEVCEVFDVLSPPEVIQLLRERRLSPWVLLNSKKFVQFFVSRVSPEERIIMESIIRPDYWKAKFEKHPDMLQNMKIYVSELKI